MALPVIEQNLHFLAQGAELLARFDDDTYTRVLSDRPRTAGVGPHFRHCLDFYLCFLRDVESGRVDYDLRDRRPELETRVAAALEAVASVSEGLSTVDDRLVERPLEVHHDEVPGEAPDSAWQRSTVARELRFLASHTVHHYALIAHLARELGIEPGEDFGVAPATLEYWTSQVTA